MALYLPGCRQKRQIDEHLQWRIVQVVDKESWSTSKQIQADLQAQSTTLLTCIIHRHLNEKETQEEPTADTDT